MKTMNRLALPAALLLAVALTSLPEAAPGQQSKPQTPAAPTRVRARLDGFDLSPKAGKSANQIGGASRDMGTPRLYAPALGKAYSLTPTFYWATADGTFKVTFRLTTINGVTLYEAASTDSHLTYPKDAPPLVPGTTYRWTVIPENDMMGGAPVPVSFTLVSGDERALIANQLSAGADAATVFVNHRIWYDAVAAYADALARDAGNQTARKGRAVLYDSLDVTQPLADADWKLVH